MPDRDRSAPSNSFDSSMSTSSPSTNTRCRICRTISVVAGSISSFEGSSRPHPLAQVEELEHQRSSATSRWAAALAAFASR
jgi:hypothetical protein